MNCHMQCLITSSLYHTGLDATAVKVFDHSASFTFIGSSSDRNQKNTVDLFSYIQHHYTIYLKQ